jgi:ubiquinone/menaquinone biosynthesis C-methylase UbiE
MTRALAVLLAIGSLAAAQEPHRPEQGHRGHGGRGRYGNPADLDAYIAHLADPKRDAWQKPDEVVAALGLRPGQTACDVGSGPGYFTLRLARAVGASGRVYAVDVEPQILDALRERLATAKLRNVTPILALADDALLPPGACDVILIVDTYHHFPERTAYLRRLSAAVKPGGRIVNVDYHKRPTPVGPPMDHRLSRETFLEEAKAAGLAVAGEPEILPYQYVVVLRPRGN